MKKLMFGLACAAAVCAFGDNSNGFEAEGLAGLTSLGTRNDSGENAGPYYFAYYAASGSTDGSTVKVYNGDGNLPTFDYNALCGLPNVFTNATANSQYLELSTEGGTLWRGWSEAADTGDDGNHLLGAGVDLLTDIETGKNIYVDTLVQFTPTEDGTAPTVDNADQMAIWLNVDSTDADAPVTNLCILASKHGYGGGVATTFKVPNKAAGGFDVVPGQWYRLTVKALPDITSYDSIPGFIVYVDGQIIKTGAATFDDDYLAALIADGNLSVDKQLITDGSVFASLWTRTDSGQTLTAPTFTGVGFKGSGAIDDLSLATDVPNFLVPAVSTIDFTLTWDENVSAVSYTIGGEETTLDVTEGTAGTATVSVDPGTTVTVKATAKAWYAIAGGTGDTKVDAATTVNVTAALAATPADAGATGLDGITTEAAKAWADAKSLTPAQITACDFALDAYLMNSDLTAKPALAIVDIAETEGGWNITVKATAGEADIDLAAINGALKVKTAATLTGLAEATAAEYTVTPGEDGKAVVKVTGDTTNFMKATVVAK